MYPERKLLTSKQDIPQMDETKRRFSYNNDELGTWQHPLIMNLMSTIINRKIASRGVGG